MWRYHAFRLHGDGTETPIVWDLPLSGVRITQALSGPGGIDAQISPEVARLTVEGKPVFVPWSTAIYAEASGQIRGAGIVEDVIADGPSLSIPCIGFSGYLTGMPYTGDYKKIQVDPLDVVRHIWGHAQGHKRGDLGMQLDTTTSDVRIGTEERDVSFQTGSGEQVDFTAGPYRLSWWKTDDLAKEIDDLAAETPFDYRETHKWAGERVEHRLELGWPKLGTRRANLRFVVGENVHTTPQIEWDGDEYADEIILLGAGDGSDMVRGGAFRDSDRLRRPRVVRDKSVTSKKRADALAEAEVKLALGDEDIQEVTIRNHPHAQIGTWQVGDDLFIQSRGDWHDDLGLWVRVLSQTILPESDEVVVRVMRAEKVTQ